MARARRDGGPRAPRDLARGHPRHGRGGGHPHRVRRHDLPRRARRAADGQGRDRRLRGALVRLPRADDDGRDGGAASATLREGDWISHRRHRPARSSRASSTTRPSEVVQVLVEKTLDAGGRARLPRVREDHGVGRRGAAARRPRERRPARPGDDRGRVRRAGHRPVPHRAHVLRRGEDRPDARDDPRRDDRGAPRRAREAPAAPARGLPRHLRGDGAAAGDDPHDRPAAARVPAPGRRGGRTSSRARPASASSRSARASRSSHESNPMLGHRGCRLGISYPEITEMQARAIFEAACDVAERGREGRARGDDPARRRTRRSSTHQAEIVRARRGGGVRRARHEGDVPRRHDDRGPARRAHRRRDREDRRVLLLRHERPHPDDVRRSRATTPARSSPPTSRRTSGRSTRSSRSTATASARSCGSRVAGRARDAART